MLPDGLHDEEPKLPPALGVPSSNVTVPVGFVLVVVSVTVAVTVVCPPVLTLVGPSETAVVVVSIT